MPDSQTNPLSASIAPLPASAAGRAQAEARALLRALRPKQWLKNGLVFLAFIFTIRQAWRPFAPSSWTPLLGDSVLAFLAFSAVSSAGYLVNDLRDIEADRLHPRKRRRPLAAGTLRPAIAVWAAVVLGAGGLGLGFALSWRFGLVLLAYGATTSAYSFGLKHIVIVDVLAIAVGFVLRAVGGAVVIAAPISPWLYLCTILGALFMALGKRRHELLLLGDDSAAHRPSLDGYSAVFLDQLISVVTASTLVAYSLYTVTATNLPANHTMLATVPFVLYGLFRYLYLIYLRDEGGSPEDVLLRDRPLLIDIGLWLATAAAVLAIFR